MRSLVAYYSYTGHAGKVADVFGKALAAKGELTIERLVPMKEVTTFAGQCRAAFMRVRAELQPGTSFDASPFDLVVIGCPVWAFAPVPAVNTWLDKVNGLSGKRAIIFLTSGSGVGVQRCFRSIRSVLESKGIAHVVEVNIPDRVSSNAQFVESAIAKAVSDVML